MLQMSKLVRSREDWRAKAIQRSLENKELRKTIAKARKKIADIKQQLKESKGVIEAEKKKKSRQPRK